MYLLPWSASFVFDAILDCHSFYSILLMKVESKFECPYLNQSDKTLNIYLIHSDITILIQENIKNVSYPKSVILLSFNFSKIKDF
jgi:hypothetical protein